MWRQQQQSMFGRQGTWNSPLVTGTHPIRALDSAKWIVILCVIGLFNILRSNQFSALVFARKNTRSSSWSHKIRPAHISQHTFAYDRESLSGLPLWDAALLPKSWSNVQRLSRKTGCIFLDRNLHACLFRNYYYTKQEGQLDEDIRVS